MLAAAICAYSESDLVHVAIGDGDFVLDPARSAERLYRFDEYLLGAPGIRFVAHVPGFFDLTGIPLRTTKRPLLALVIDCVSAGRLGSDTCVTTVVRILNAVGEHIPKSVTTPAELLGVLNAKGHEVIAIDGAPGRRAP